MTNIIPTIGRLLAFSVVLIGSHNLAQAGFCGNYIQTSSNAGQCNNCRLSIADNPKIQKYFVTANNGWRAQLNWNHGDDSTASGSGNWNNGQRFTIDLSQQGRRLNLIMSNPGSGPIRASFNCLDPQKRPTQKNRIQSQNRPKNCVAFDQRGQPFRVVCPN